MSEIVYEFLDTIKKEQKKKEQERKEFLKSLDIEDDKIIIFQYSLYEKDLQELLNKFINFGYKIISSTSYNYVEFNPQLEKKWIYSIYSLYIRIWFKKYKKTRWVIQILGKRLVIIDYDISYIYYIDLNTNYTKVTKPLAIIHKMSYNELNSKWIKK